MRIAHIIMVHKNPDQVIRLIRRLQHTNADFYVHIDAKSNIEEFEAVADLPQVSLIKKRVNCNWGGNSLFIGILTAVREVLSLNKGYSFLNLLSAQDYPLRSAAEIHEYFENNIGYNFISYEPADSKWWQAAVSRYERYHFTDLTFMGKHLAEKMVNIFLPTRRFPLPVTLYGGCKSTWWTISEDCANYISSQLSNNKRLSAFLKYCWGTDEFVLPTLIMNSPYKAKVVDDNLRYIDWSEGNARPKLLGIEDFSAMKESGMLIARKFEIDTLILDKIDQELLGLE